MTSAVRKSASWPLGVLSSDMRDKVSNARVLVVGAGGIGCELLKTLVMTGFRHLEVIDLDTIETSNLNRQFLFRQHHVGQSKASVAAKVVQKMAPGVNIKAYQANVKEPRFSPEFISGFSIVLNGLDNLEARRHVNRLCLAAGVPLVESGTAGFLGQVSVHIGGQTECFECQPKPTPRNFPVCTIRNTPDKPIHCIVWAKDLLFGRLFGPADAVTDLDDKPSGEQEDDHTESGKSEYLRGAEEDVLQFAARIFRAFFVDDVRRLAAVEDMWKERPPPTPSAVNLAPILKRVGGLQIKGENGAAESLGLTNPQALWTPEENTSVLIATIAAFHTTRLEELGSLTFDKDDALAVEFVTAASNLRAHCYGIPLQSLFDAKGMAGNIIHAVATTNAIASGLIVIEALKVLAGETSKCHTTFLLAHVSNNKILTPMAAPEPNPKCIICGTAQLILRADLDAMTLEDVVHHVLKKRLALISPTVVSGSFMYEEGDDLEPDEVEFNQANLNKLLKNLPGGGLHAGSTMDISDQAQQLNFRIILEHQSVWDEEAVPERWEIKGDLPAKGAAEKEPSEEEDDDVLDVTETALPEPDTKPATGVRRREDHLESEPATKRSRLESP